MPEWDGPERRKDYVEIDHALEKVQHLHNAVLTLADAVGNTVPRKELANLQAEVAKDFRYKLYFQAGLTVIACIFLVIVFARIEGDVNAKIEKGHAVINCLQGKTEAERTGTLAATALITCEQTTK